MTRRRRSVLELRDCAGRHLEEYCASSSAFGWPDYDTDPARGRLVPGDLLAPAWLSYAIPAKYLQLMSADDGNAYNRLRKAVADVVEITAEDESFLALASCQRLPRRITFCGFSARASRFARASASASAIVSPGSDCSSSSIAARTFASSLEIGAVVWAGRLSSSRAANRVVIRVRPPRSPRRSRGHLGCFGRQPPNLGH